MITIRKASADDEALYLRWANDPAVRANAFSMAPIAPAEHARWFRSRLGSTGCFLFVFELGDTPVAQVRFDVEGEQALLDYSVDADHRGQGFGKRALQHAIVEFYSHHYSNVTIVARVKKGNLASSRAFLWMGFAEETAEEWNHYRLSAAQLAIPYLVMVSNPGNYTRMYRQLSSQMGRRILFVARSSDLTRAKLELLNPRILFFVQWPGVVPPEIFERWTSIIFQMADLPFGRGGNPLQNLIVRGFKETAICALAVQGGPDSGLVYARVPLSLDGSVREILERAGAAIAGLIEQFALHPPKPERGTP